MATPRFISTSGPSAKDRSAGVHPSETTTASRPVAAPPDVAFCLVPAEREVVLRPYMSKGRRHQGGAYLI